MSDVYNNIDKLEDVIEFLRNMEPVKPGMGGPYNECPVCGHCGEVFDAPHIYNYCPVCGRKVDYRV